MKPLFYLFKTNRKWPTNFKAYKKITFPVILPAMSKFQENLKVNKLAKKKLRQIDRRQKLLF